MSILSPCASSFPFLLLQTLFEIFFQSFQILLFFPRLLLSFFLLIFFFHFFLFCFCFSLIISVERSFFHPSRSILSSSYGYCPCLASRFPTVSQSSLGQFLTFPCRVGGLSPPQFGSAYNPFFDFSLLLSSAIFRQTPVNPHL